MKNFITPFFLPFLFDNKKVISLKKQYIRLALFLAILISYATPIFAASEKHNDVDDEFNVTEMIMHHIKDSYGWHILDYTNKTGEKVDVTIPLPIILYYNGHLDVFMSSAFHHGHSDVVKDGRTYSLQHGSIVAETHNRVPQEDTSHDGHSEETHDHASQAENANHAEGDSFLDFSITRNVAAMMISCLILLLVFVTAARHYKKNPERAPKGIAGFMEPLILFVRDDIAVPNIGVEKAGKFMGYLLTVFFFILINNILGLIPIFPGASNVTGNIAVTMVLAVITFLFTNLNGSSDYWKHIFWPDGIPKWILPILVPVEIIGLFTKPFALMIRLFANITAGHIIILSLISLIFVFESVYVSPLSVAFGLFMNVLEILVAFLQAYIFTMLSALFIGMAVQKHH